MAQQIWQALTYTAIPVIATVLGGIIAAFRPPGAILRSLIQHFAAGVVFAAVAVEVLPPLKEQTPWATALGGAIGIAVMLGLRWWTTRIEQNTPRAGEGGFPVGLLAATAVDLFVDGLLIGAALTAGEKQGLLLTIALTLELLFLGLSVAASLGSASRTKVIAVTTGLSGMVLAGSLLGVMVLGHVSQVTLATVLAFGAIALLYLVTEELLVEAHEGEKTPLLGAATLFVGFLLYLLISESVE